MIFVGRPRLRVISNDTLEHTLGINAEHKLLAVINEVKSKLAAGVTVIHFSFYNNKITQTKIVKKKSDNDNLIISFCFMVYFCILFFTFRSFRMRQLRMCLRWMLSRRFCLLQKLRRSMNGTGIKPQI